MKDKSIWLFVLIEIEIIREWWPKGYEYKMWKSFFEVDGLKATHSPVEISRTTVAIKQMKWPFHVTVLIFIHLHNKHIVCATVYREVKWFGAITDFWRGVDLEWFIKFKVSQVRTCKLKQCFKREMNWNSKLFENKKKELLISSFISLHQQKSFRSKLSFLNPI